MNTGVRRIVMWVAEILDRNLITVPDVDELDASNTQPSQPRARVRLAPKLLTHRQRHEND